MGRFRGTVKGVSGVQASVGTTRSGLTGVVNGWDAGIRVEARASKNAADTDAFDVYLTAGTLGGKQDALILTYDDGHLIVYDHSKLGML